MTKKIVMLLVCAATVFAAQAQDATESVVKKQTRRQKFDRGLAFDTKTPVMPKGLWVFGVNVSYSEHKNDDYKFLIVKDFNSVGNTLNLSPQIHYVIANNQSLGVRFQYKRNWFRLDKVALDLGEDLNGDIGPYEYNNHTYMGFLTYRYYLGLGNSKRFLLFNEVQAGIGGGQQKELSGTNDAGDGYKTGTYQNTFNLKLGLMPGMIAFITNEVAIEVAVGLMGFNYQNITQTTDQVIKGSRKTSSISTKIDLLAINFGMTFYL